MKQFPALYQQGPRNIHFSWSRIIGWILNGVVSSLVTFLANIHILSPGAYRQNGYVADLNSLGAITYTCIIWTVNCQIALITSHFTWIQHLSIWGSILLWYIFLALYGALPPYLSGKAFQVLIEAIGPSPLYWLITLLVVFVSLLPYFIHIVIQRSFYPMDDHIIQEIKYCLKKNDATDNEMWFREQRKSQRSTHVGFSARVDARVLSFQEQVASKEFIVL